MSQPDRGVVHARGGPGCGALRRGPRRARAVGVALGAVLSLGLVTGCGGEARDVGGGADGGVTASASGSASGTASPEPAGGASTDASSPASPAVASSALAGLSEDERQAFAEATEVVMAYRQIVTDLYSGVRTRVNDLDAVVTGDKLERSRLNVSQGLSEGYRSEPEGVQVVLVSAEPVSVDLAGDPPTVVIRACVDATAEVRLAPNGSRTQGVREELQYVIVRTSYLPGRGWAIAKELGSPESEEREC